MNQKLILVFIAGISIFASFCYARNEDFGYVDVREGAHMFWWLIGTDDGVKNAPLIIWLQGGPGGSSTGFGNFLEIGPYNVSMKEREEPWTKVADLLFVDNPVGTGYSYVDSKDKLTKNNKEIGDDLVSLMKEFIKKHPEYQTRPLYIFCESYGGKMTVAMALAIQSSVNRGELKVNLTGIALGDAWISPIDYCRTWGEYLRSFSLVDDKQIEVFNGIVDQIKEAMKEGKGETATELWDDLEMLVEMYTDNVDFYNVLNHENSEIVKKFMQKNINKNLRRLYKYANDELDVLMNSKEMRRKLNISDNVVWGKQRGDVFSYLSNDFMNPVISDVDILLESGLKVVVYNGQLDLICDTLGTLDWVNQLKWSGISYWKNNATKKAYFVENTRKLGGFFKNYKNFEFYWIMMAGHMAPTDNPKATIEMVKKIISNN